MKLPKILVDVDIMIIAASMEIIIGDKYKKALLSSLIIRLMHLPIPSRISGLCDVDFTKLQKKKRAINRSNHDANANIPRLKPVGFPARILINRIRRKIRVGYLRILSSFWVRNFDANVKISDFT